MAAAVPGSRTRAHRSSSRSPSRDSRRGGAAPAPRRDTLRRRSASARCCTRAARGPASRRPCRCRSPALRRRRARVARTRRSSVPRGMVERFAQALLYRIGNGSVVTCDRPPTPSRYRRSSQPTTSRRYAVVFASSSALAQYARRCGGLTVGRRARRRVRAARRDAADERAFERVAFGGVEVFARERCVDRFRRRSSAVRPAPSTHRRTDRGRRCACCPSGRPRSRAAARRRGRSRASRAASRRRRTAIARAQLRRVIEQRGAGRHASAGTAGARRPRAGRAAASLRRVRARRRGPARRLAEMRFERNHVERHEAEHHLAHLVRRAQQADIGAAVRDDRQVLQVRARDLAHQRHRLAPRPHPPMPIVMPSASCATTSRADIVLSRGFIVIVLAYRYPMLKSWPHWLTFVASNTACFDQSTVRPPKPYSRSKPPGSSCRKDHLVVAVTAERRGQLHVVRGHAIERAARFVHRADFRHHVHAARRHGHLAARGCDGARCGSA